MRAWAREAYQRNALVAAVLEAGARPSDLVFIGDVDELPHPAALRSLQACAEAYVFPVYLHMTHLVYSVNWRADVRGGVTRTLSTWLLMHAVMCARNAAGTLAPHLCCTRGTAVHQHPGLPRVGVHSTCMMPVHHVVQ